MFKKQVGVIGMSVMGRNLAINIENHGYKVSIFNRSFEKTKKIISEHKEKNLVPFDNIEDFVKSLIKPRCILLMVQSGQATDNVIQQLKKFLEKGDIIIDGGNSHYKDTIRRNKELSESGLNFIGAGISGGSEGALHGPSIMPGGQKYAYKLIEPMLKKISAYFENTACVTYIGPDGSGHYVKMVHNGIEYADMQLIAESYSLLKNILFLKNDQLSEIFNQWNSGELNSYLIDITKNIFQKKDTHGNYLIDMILDKADTKGTGKWSSQSALDLEEPLNMITESIFSRYLSLLKLQRIKASKVLAGPIFNSFNENKKEFIEKIRKALFFGKIISYSQGFSQLRTASEKYNWNLNYKNIAKIFRSGCIIRAKILQKIIDAYSENENIINLLLTQYFQKIVNNYQSSIRDVVTYGIKFGIPIPVFSAAIAYYDSYRSIFLPANLTQAQRDYFGAHNYQRIDKEGIFHSNWLK